MTTIITFNIFNILNNFIINYTINFINENFIILFSFIIIGTLTSYIHFSGKKILESVAKTVVGLGALGSAYSGGSQAYKDYKSSDKKSNTNTTPNSNSNSNTTNNTTNSK